jgi:hypothetical protein
MDLLLFYKRSTHQTIRYLQLHHDYFLLHYSQQTSLWSDFLSTDSVQQSPFSFRTLWSSVVLSMNTMETSHFCVWLCIAESFWLWTLRCWVIFADKRCGQECFLFLKSVEQSIFISERYGEESLLFLNSVHQYTRALFFSEHCTAETFLCLNSLEQNTLLLLLPVEHNNNFCL